MKILLDIGHPKDVNVFKNVIFYFQNNGHEVRIFVRAKENTKNILKEYSLPYDEGKYYNRVIGKAFGIIINDIRLYRVAKKFKPDIFVSPGSPYSAHVSRMIRKPHIAFSDTEIANLVMNLMLPFTDIIYTPSCFYVDLGPKQVRFNSYYELAYLSPKYFTPKKEVLEKYGLKGDYIILRLSALASHHDINAKGFGFKNEKELRDYINKLEKYARVIILSETEDWATIRNYQLVFDSKDLHDILYFSKLYIGEGATMASEAAVLGVPSIYVSNTRRGYLDELEEKYDLAYTISEKKKALEKAISLLENDDLKGIWKSKRELMLKEKIDTVEFMVNMIENSISIKM